MSPSQIIVLATPVFLLLIAVELAVGYQRRRNTYRLADAVSSISLGMLSQTSASGRTQSMTLRLLDRLLQQGAMQVLAQQPVVDNALDAVAQTAMQNSLDIRR